jgi:hypothetical protein
MYYLSKPSKYVRLSTCMYLDVTAGQGKHADEHYCLLACGRDPTPVFIPAGATCPASRVRCGRTYMMARIKVASPPDVCAHALDQHYTHMQVSTRT